MVEEIQPSELEATLETDEAPTIVDIRNPVAFGEEHIPGSHNIPFQELPQEVDRVEGDDHVVTVCPHGEASVQAARLIASYEGFDGEVESLQTGLTGWEGPVTDAPSSGDEPDESPDAPF